MQLVKISGDSHVEGAAARPGGNAGLFLRPRRALVPERVHQRRDHDDPDPPLVPGEGAALCVTLRGVVSSPDTVLISGALGSVGRCAVFSAKDLGAKVIAGVRGKQIEEAKKLPGVVEAVAIDDDDALARIGLPTAT